MNFGPSCLPNDNHNVYLFALQFSLTWKHLVMLTIYGTTYLEITRGVEEKVAGLEISVKYIGRVDVFEATQDLVQEVTHMVIAQLLGLEKFVHVCLH